MDRLKAIHNGEKTVPTFSNEDMEERLSKLRKLMSDRGLDAVLFTSIQNVNYFGDFLYCAFGRSYGLIVSAEDTVIVAANIDGGAPWRRARGDAIAYTDWHRDNFFHAVETRVGRGRRVGLEYDHLSVENFAKLRDALPDCDFVDVSGSVMALRMIKSAAEIALITEGARIADIGGAACVEAVAEGVPEYVVALHATEAMVRAIATRFPDAELRDSWTWFQSGPNTDGAHNPVTTRRIQRGDILSLNCFPMIAGYYTALERTLFCAEASARHRALWEINCAVHRRGLELIRPGARCCDIAAALNEIYREHELLPYRTFGYGHSFGVLCHYYGREAGLELREDVETVLEPGMVISMEPMIMIPEEEEGAGGYREHDILVVTENGAENLTQFPFGPAHNIVGG